MPKDRSLIVALCLLGVAGAFSPLPIRLADGEWHWPLIGLAAILTAPIAACVGWSINQRRRHRSTPTFATRPLVVSARLIAATVVAVGFGVIGILVSFVLVPVASALLAVAWVQPPRRGRARTAVTGFALLAFVVWFVGRADEYLSEAIMSGAGIAVAATVLAGFRKRGALASR